MQPNAMASLMIGNMARMEAYSMAQLNRQQQAFLDHHQIPLSRVFDASGLTASEWQRSMRDLDLWVAYGGAKCRMAGHQLRSSNSICLQCRPAAIGFIRRYFEAGEVYVAKSVSQRVLKVGTAKIAAERIYQLSVYEYGGAKDWILCFSNECANAGRVEFEAHRLLASKLSAGTYFKNGEYKECRELFKCSEAEGIAAVRKAVRTHS
jgi:T5orf172 domain